MAIFLCLTMLCFFPLGFGMWNEKIWKTSWTNWSMTYLSGLLLFFVLFETTGIVGIKLGWSFEQMSYLFIGSCTLVTLGSFIFCGNKWLGIYEETGSSSLFTWQGRFLIGISSLLLSYVSVYTITGTGDGMLETVMTTKYTGTIFEYNPLTGQVFGNGMYPVTKFSLISIFYATLTEVTGMAPLILLQRAIPMFLLVGSFILFYLWTGAFFEEKKERQETLVWFGALFLLAEKKPWCYTYRILAEGYKGNTIWMLLVLPFVLFWVMKLWKTVRKKILAVIMTLSVFGVATLFLVNTTTIISDLSLMVRHNLGKESGYYILVLLYMIWKKSQTVDGINKEKGIYAIAYFVLCFLLGMWIPLVAVAVTDALYTVLLPFRKRAIAGILLILFLTGPMELYPSQISSDYVKNEEKNILVEEVVYELDQLSAKSEHEEILVAPVEIMQEVRKEIPNMILPYGKDYWIPGINKEVGDIYSADVFALYASMLEVVKHPYDTLSLAESQGCNVFVSPVSLEDIGNNAENWSLYKEVPGYFIYCR